ncbi:unnamed protein product [Sphenostylis stenocarpa]|uniref:Cation efflux protein cytoplasmic domain-containing protein n=1 Tax=Sphenostylis stenocarpa TaxID=92480 RepID=A0AA86V522_9FABA|nr:unnamed protein product [Sphenostylis stenocarpa]
MDTIGFLRVSLTFGSKVVTKDKVVTYGILQANDAKLTVNSNGHVFHIFVNGVQTDQDQLRSVTEAILISLLVQCSCHGPRADFFLFVLWSLCGIGCINWDSLLPSLLSSVSSAELPVGQLSQAVPTDSSSSLSQTGMLPPPSTIANSSNFQSSNPASPLTSVHTIGSPAQSTIEPLSCSAMSPGIVVFASAMATLGLQILFESAREIITKAQPERDPVKEKWMIGIMVAATLVKVALMTYCRRFKNEIVRAYAQDHFFDVITNSIGLATAVLAIKFYWWLDPVGAILIALYTISNWAKTVMENVWSLIGKTAPPEFLAKLTYLCWNHNKEIKHIDTVRAYTFGSNYFVEVDIVVSEEMSLAQAHDIGETLQDKLEKLPEIERAFVHTDFNITHKLEHKPKVV